MPTPNLDRPTTVSRCRIPGHSSHVAGCATCKAFSAFQFRRRKWEKQHGIDCTPVPVDQVAGHVEMLVNEGNWKVVDIAATSGIGSVAVYKILNRRTQRVLRITADSLLALQPRTTVRAPMSTLVPSLEAIRIARGLAAQGWTFKHMSELAGYNSNNTIPACARRERRWVAEETLLKLRELAVRLGRFDMAQLDAPMPGMRSHILNMARRRSWVPLAAWYGQDLADPEAVPWKIRPTGSPLIVPVVRPAVVVDQDDDLPEVSPWSYIDPILTLRVAEAADVVRRTNKENGRRPEGYITPIKYLTRAEAYVLVDVAAKAGISATLTGLMLGYRISTKSELSNAQRAVERMKATFKEGRQLLDQLVFGEKVDPGWCFQSENGNGVNDFAAVLTAVLAVQGAPFGPGWSPAELAQRAGVGEDAMRAFLAYATRRADAPYEVKHITRRQPVTSCTELTDLVVPVDLGAVLTA
jgi:hypothetical protein